MIHASRVYIYLHKIGGNIHLQEEDYVTKPLRENIFHLYLGVTYISELCSPNRTRLLPESLDRNDINPHTTIPHHHSPKSVPYYNQIFGGNFFVPSPDLI